MRRNLFIEILRQDNIDNWGIGGREGQTRSYCDHRHFRYILPKIVGYEGKIKFFTSHTFVISICWWKASFLNNLSDLSCHKYWHKNSSNNFSFLL